MQREMAESGQLRPSLPPMFRDSKPLTTESSWAVSISLVLTIVQTCLKPNVVEFILNTPSDVTGS